MSCDVVILEIGENRRKLLRNISGIKYKILLSTKFKNNIPYELNTCEIRFLELSMFQEIIRKSKVNSVLKTFHEIIPKFVREIREDLDPTLSKFLFPVQPVVYPAVQWFDRVIPHWKRGPGPSRTFPARPVIIPSNTRRQPRA